MAQFANVILPLSIPHALHYEIPVDMRPFVKIGIRVEVPLGKNKLYAGLVYGLSDTKPALVKPKKIVGIIDSSPILDAKHLRFWQWIADYYCCHIGEVMAASVPSALRMSSDSVLVPSPFFDEDYTDLSHKEYLVLESIKNRGELKIDEVKAILGQKSVQGIIQKLLYKKLLFLKEAFDKQYKPMVKEFVRLTPVYASYQKNEFLVDAMFDKVKNAKKQELVLLSYFQFNMEEVGKKELLEKAEAPDSAIKALVKKEIFETYSKKVSRLDSIPSATTAINLSPAQQKAFGDINALFEQKQVVLLHGVTGSGKTEVYFELIKKHLAKEEQVLFLLPEIALTTQMIHRLHQVFGEQVQVFHSRVNHQKRVEVWKSALEDTKIIVGSRSALFLPFQKLGLIIIDESHDSSYKQADPAPRYQGRDAAIYLAHLCHAKVLMGTATPSVESYYNCKKGKYGLVHLNERYGQTALPSIQLIDKAIKIKAKAMRWSYSDTLISNMEETMARGEQIIIFQNRRGYAPLIFCTGCGWIAECPNCDVSLTYHLQYKNLQCHLCGHTTAAPAKCPSCGDPALRHRGLGTEKVEEELQTLLPSKLIKRMDLDSVRSKKAYLNLLKGYESGEIDILIGTKMVTKGLDFKNVGLVGVVSAESLLFFPDFRAIERTFQLLTQVAGRAGRRSKQGKVLIQSYKTDHPVFEEIIKNDYTSFYEREIMERQEFGYPPFTRIIKISIRHKNVNQLDLAAKILYEIIAKDLKPLVYGPSIPKISRIRNYFCKEIMLKIPRQDLRINSIKHFLMNSMTFVSKQNGLGSTRFIVDVDPCA